jgi:tetratricopeptide (TPR) repeat protein
VTYGYLGECYFQSGDARKALLPTQQALQLSRHGGDTEGMIAYLGNLYEIHRYLGEPNKAADAAEELVVLFGEQGQSDEAERYRQQAQRVRAGEPLNRVIVSIDGRRMELDEVLAGTTGQVQFAFERNRLTLRPARVRTDQGEKLAHQGRFEKALAHFRHAAEADRYDPQCRYQEALTLLYLQRHGEAAEAYDLTEELAPGWFHCRSDLWLAQQLYLGKLPHEVFLIWHAVQDGPLPPAEKVRLAEKGLKQAPNLPLLLQPLGKNLRAVGRAAEAEAAWRRGLARAEEADIKTRLLVDVAAVTADTREKQDLLHEAIELNGNLVAAAMARVVLAFE